MATFFQLELRVVPCTTCGAPLEGLRAGGAVSCRYCRASQEVTAREDTPIVVGPRMADSDRIVFLKQQDAFARPTPPALDRLVFGDRLVPWQVSQALARWQVARREHDADELFALTCVLSAHYERTRASMEERAIVEGALDEVIEPRQRQILRGILARAAALTGDVTAAHAWLASCDPHATDLEADGAYRFARACLETVRGNPAGVLEALGQTPTDVPLPNDLDPVAQTLRANAWERLGHQDQAIQMLVHLAEHGGPMFHLRARELLEAYPQHRLCERSAPAAEEQIQRIYRERAYARSFGRLGGIILFGVIMLVLAVAAVVGSIFAEVYELGFGLHPVTYFVAVLFAMIGLILLLLGGHDSLRQRSEQKLRETGRLVPGVVVHRVATGNATMGVAEMMVRVLVLDRGTGYLASTTAFFRDPDAPGFARGKLVSIRIDPDDPHAFSLVL